MSSDLQNNNRDNDLDLQNDVILHPFGANANIAGFLLTSAMIGLFSLVTYGLGILIVIEKNLPVSPTFFIQILFPLTLFTLSITMIAISVYSLLHTLYIPTILDVGDNVNSPDSPTFFALSVFPLSFIILVIIAIIVMIYKVYSVIHKRNQLKKLPIPKKVIVAYQVKRKFSFRNFFSIICIWILILLVISLLFNVLLSNADPKDGRCDICNEEARWELQSDNVNIHEFCTNHVDYYIFINPVVATLELTKKYSDYKVVFLFYTSLFWLYSWIFVIICATLYGKGYKWGDRCRVKVTRLPFIPF
jgi:hypothetical protein